jgi:nitrile hydratase accessory protein
MSGQSGPEQVTASLTGPAALPRQNGELVFAAPWEGRVFGMALALHEQQAYAWDEFRDRLLAELAQAGGADDPAAYYERWLASLERLLVEKGLVTPAEVAARAAELAARSPEDDHHQ